jgi:6,7-dimethyl-8-ribityllumazine synthase
MQQALERAGIKSNKGWDYAMNALEMASLMRQLRSSVAVESYGNSSQPLPASLKSAVAGDLSAVPEELG